MLLITAWQIKEVFVFCVQASINDICHNIQMMLHCSAIKRRTNKQENQIKQIQI